jgi:zinc protease
MVEASKRHEIADAEFQKNSVTGLAFAWSRAVAVEGRNSPEDIVRALRKVTLDDVNRVARKYLENKTAFVAVLTPKVSGKAVSSKGFRGKESFSPERTKKAVLPAWAQKAASLPAGMDLSIKPYDVTLPNGLRLIVQPETISNTVSVYGQVRTSPYMQEPKGKEGVARILDGLFSYGTKKLDRLSFQKALDDIAANESAGSSFVLQVLEDHFERGIELLAGNLLEPALPEDGLKVLKAETGAMLAGKLKSPSYIFGRTLRKALYPPGDPELREATPETVVSITHDDVRRYYEHTFRPDMTTVVVIGRITPEQAESAVEKYFGAWTAAGPKPVTDLPHAPLNRPSSAAVPDNSRVQVEVVLAENLEMTRSDEAYYPLQTGIHVLSGAFYATRLYRDLREEAGLVYTVRAALDARKTRSDFSIAYACDPQNVSKARALAERDLREMQSRPVSPEELAQAKILLLRNIPLSQSSIDSIAEGFLSRSMKDLPLDEPARAAKRYRAVTADLVMEAFAAWIHPGRLVQVTLGPEPE